MRKQKDKPGVVVRGNHNRIFLVGPGSFRDAVIVVCIAVTVLAVLLRCPDSLSELISMIRTALGN